MKVKSFMKFIVYGHNQMEKETKEALVENVKYRNKLAQFRGDSLSLADAKETDLD